MQGEFTPKSSEEESLGETRPDAAHCDNIPSASSDESKVKCDTSQDVELTPVLIDHRNYEKNKCTNFTSRVKVMEYYNNIASSSSGEEVHSMVVTDSLKEWKVEVSKSNWNVQREAGVAIGSIIDIEYTGSDVKIYNYHDSTSNTICAYKIKIV